MEMMKRLLAIIVVGLLLTGSVQAAKVSQETAGSVAHNFMERQGVKTQLTLVLTITPSQGIEDVQGNGILIYPVPTSGMLYLGEEVESVELYDFAGRLVLLASRTRKLDLSSLPTGAYMLKLLQFDGSVTQHRVVKQ